MPFIDSKISIRLTDDQKEELKSDVEKNPMLWLVEINGIPVDARTLPLETQIYCAKRGLIPYVPGIKGD